MGLDSPNLPGSSTLKHMVDLLKGDYGGSGDQTYYCSAIVLRHTDSSFSRPVKRNCLVAILIPNLGNLDTQLYFFDFDADRRRLPEIAPPIESEVPWTPSPLWICVQSILLASVGWYLSRRVRALVPKPARKVEIVVEPKTGKPPLQRTDSVDLCDVV